jgi:hypothetical protein
MKQKMDFLKAKSHILEIANQKVMGVQGGPVPTT